MKIRNVADIRAKILKAVPAVIAETKEEKGDDYFTGKRGFFYPKAKTVFNKACKKAFGGLTFDEICRARTVFEEKDYTFTREKSKDGTPGFL